MILDIISCNVIQTMLIILFLNSGQTRIVIKEEKLTADLSNDIDDKTTENAVYIDLPTSVPPIDILNNTIIEDDLKKNKLKDKDVSANCTDTELSENIIDIDETKLCIPEVKDKTNKPLILTTFIKGGRENEGRKACRVDSSLFLKVESYSGYFTVDETHDANMFFWYFPVEKKPLNETPLIIWMQGGPGATSMTGNFDEIGPFYFSARNNLTKNPNTWLQNYSLLFIDNPVGTGFSFVGDENGYVTDMETYGKHLYATVKQFYQVFPELRTAPLYVAGESYAGKYVPSLAIEIHKYKNSTGGDINLQGLILGNPYIDPEMLKHVTRPFYYFGLLDKQQISKLQPLLDDFQRDVEANRSVDAKEKWTRIIVLLIMLSHQQHAYNFLRDDLGVGAYISFLERPEVRHALHVGDVKFHFINLKVNTKLAPDFLSSSKHMYEELLNKYRVLTYCGQLDQMLPCAHTTEHYQTWHWSSREEFLNATRFPFLYQGKLAGYYKSGGRLTEVVIRGAGHMVPMDRAAPLRDLVVRWIQQQPLSKDFGGVFMSSFLDQFIRNHSKIEAMPYL